MATSSPSSFWYIMLIRAARRQMSSPTASLAEATHATAYIGTSIIKLRKPAWLLYSTLQTLLPSQLPTNTNTNNPATPLNLEGEGWFVRPDVGGRHFETQKKKGQTDGFHPVLRGDFLGIYKLPLQSYLQHLISKKFITALRPAPLLSDGIRECEVRVGYVSKITETCRYISPDSSQNPRTIFSQPSLRGFEENPD
ncbi:hypothetical protein K440DRAFT_630217 [Wilcoxina mikolae CBS 423.85]|nr:hypothetical protein K440DRAFT_630217 [Wilcoxina mikolae CBS 423.85]